MPKPRKPSLRVLVRKYLRYWRKRFELPDWPMFYQGVSYLKGPDGADALATINVNTSSLEINLKYDSHMPPDEGLVNRLLAHEVLHWVFDAVDTFVENKLSEEDHGHYKDVQEQAIETVAIALTGVRQDKPASLWWYGKENDGCEH